MTLLVNFIVLFSDVEFTEEIERNYGVDVYNN